MQDFDTIRTHGAAGARSAAIDAGLRAYMNRVYGLMAFAMVITGAVAFVVGNSPAMLQAIFGGPQKYLVMFAPLIMVFVMGGMINKLSVAGAQMMFWAYSALMGLSISFIFAVYTGMSIAQVFLTTAIAFGGVSLYGYTTKKDISGWGSFLMMGVIGLVVASIINIFLASSALMFAVNVIGVLVFAGLTAYDTQRLKNDYLGMAQFGAGADVMGKSAIMGALSLYINFINMFMMMLSLFGDRE
ncbi:Bax inhibitor-1/YccA family protein [Rhodovulum sp. DZ06]|uniref:Bax inhibitor-1/YccA family protein n=1 Tax=Rhodovulum sp. DZ06 TaxID=3425126 RepID=UPI003D345C9C